MSTPSSDLVVVGGGVVGLSMAYGMARRGHSVTVLDEGDRAFRASRGNFGLVWVQGKGLHQPRYSQWSRLSASLWPEWAAELSEVSGLDLSLRQEGGYSYHLSEQSLNAEVESYRKLRTQLDGDYPFEVLGHNALRAEEPMIGPSVAGAILHPEDGHVNPLRLLQALSVGVRKLAVNIVHGVKVDSISALKPGFKVHSANQSWHCERVLLCAGLGTATLGPPLGFVAPLRAQRGQILITSKLPNFINRPSGTIRQVDEGGVQIGASAEEVGLDDRETLATTASLAREAIEVFPCLAHASLVRSWAALRIMSPDGLPVYQQSECCPGAFLITCHSGITLSAAHSQSLPLWLDQQPDRPDLQVFSEQRFVSRRSDD